MPKFFVDKEKIVDNRITIIGNDVNHIKNVLRKNKGDVLTICNTSNEKDYLGKIIEINDEKVVLDIIEELSNNTESNIKVTIMQGIPKSDKMELIIQKSVELGVFDITPIEMKRCVVKLDEKDKQKKIARWQKISEVASKQSGRNIIPKINQVTNLKNICNLINEYDIVLVAYENEKNTTIKEELMKIKEKISSKEQIIKIAVIIGPEGGIDEEEIKLLQEKGTQLISLGKRILRTETVALNVLSIIIYELEL